MLFFGKLIQKRQFSTQEQGKNNLSLKTWLKIRTLSLSRKLLVLIIKKRCNSLYALCWSTIKRVSVWTTSDLDYVLENGDSLFKSINTNMALNVDDLPANINIEGFSLDVILLENEAGVMNSTEQFNVPKMSFQTKTNTGTRAIFFIYGYTFALIWHKSEMFLCDSHSRNKEGLITADGASILLKFKTLNDVQNYIKEVNMLSQNFRCFLIK